MLSQAVPSFQSLSFFLSHIWRIKVSISTPSFLVTALPETRQIPEAKTIKPATSTWTLRPPSYFLSLCLSLFFSFPLLKLVSHLIHFSFRLLYKTSLLSGVHTPENSLTWNSWLPSWPPLWEPCTWRPDWVGTHALIPSRCVTFLVHYLSLTFSFLIATMRIEIFNSTRSWELNEGAYMMWTVGT